MTRSMNPTISISGDSPETLIADRLACLSAIVALKEALIQTVPNGRNYIGRPDDFDRDRDIYRERWVALNALRDDLTNEALAIQSQGA